MVTERPPAPGGGVVLPSAVAMVVMLGRPCGPKGRRSAAGGEFSFGLDARIEFGEVLLARVLHQVDLAAGPRRQLHSRGQAYPVDALGAVGDQRGAVVDVIGEVGQPCDVLLAPDGLVLLDLGGV